MLPEIWYYGARTMPNQCTKYGTRFTNGLTTALMLARYRMYCERPQASVSSREHLCEEPLFWTLSMHRSVKRSISEPKEALALRYEVNPIVRTIGGSS